MRQSTLLLALATARSAFSNVIAERAGCNANNCLRGVRGTDINLEPPLTSRLSDCSSFMKVTVTPAPTTSTYTITVTSTLPFNKRNLVARQVTVSPSSVPAYATYCPDPSAYSSACSCVGITAYTSMAPTPTVTAYATVILDVCPAAGETNCGGTCHDLSSSSSNCGTCGTVCPSGDICSNGACVLDLNKYKCSNPATCDASSTCGGGCGYCHPDSNGQGYCVGGGSCLPSNSCSTNSDCASSLCLDTCCGKTCDTAAGNFCYAPTVKRLFGKRDGGDQNDFTLVAP